MLECKAMATPMDTNLKLLADESSPMRMDGTLLGCKAKKESCMEVLPPQLYLVVFHQVSLVNQTRIACSDFRRPSILLLGKFVVLYHMFIPHGGIVINVLA